MSTDINLSRPSTRVRASPGGATTICFGDEHITSAKPPMAPVAAVVVATKPIVVPPEGADNCNRKCNIPHTLNGNHSRFVLLYISRWSIYNLQKNGSLVHILIIEDGWNRISSALRSWGNYCWSRQIAGGKRHHKRCCFTGRERQCAALPREADDWKVFRDSCYRTS